MQKHVVIFAKDPRIGRVKTRLGREIGAVAAWRFYRSMLHSLPRRLNKKGPWRVWLAVSPDHVPTKRFMSGQLDILQQGGGDLGQRMYRPAFRLPPGPFVVIGTDIPEIQPGDIHHAFQLLGKKDAVFGPSDDGGFWLVGLKRHGILANPYRKAVRWSHEETLNDCLANLKRHKVGFLRSLNDIDTSEDLRTWRENRQR